MVLIKVQDVVKTKGMQLMANLTTIDLMHEWSTTYLTSPNTLYRKDELGKERDK